MSLTTFKTNLKTHLFQMYPSQSTRSQPTPTEMKEWEKKIILFYPKWKRKMYSFPPVHFTKNLCKDEVIAGTPVKVLKRLETHVSSSVSTSQLSGSASTNVASQRGQVTPSKHIMTSFPPVPSAPIKNPPITSAAGAQVCRKRKLQPETQARPVDASDVRADRAQQRTLQCLQTLCKERNEAMFLISELDFSYVLSKRNSVLAPSAPQDRGDFDILIIHPRFGILIGEVKAVGYQSDTVTAADLKKRLSKVVKQLDKSEVFVRKAVKGIAPNILIRKTVILPYVSKKQLSEFLDNCLPLKKELIRCVVAKDTQEFSQLSLLEDQMLGHSDSLQVPDTVKTHLETWWQHRMACQSDPGMSETVYLTLLARFCGQATTVKVYCPEHPRLVLRTDSDVIQVLGDKMSSLMLTEAQFTLVHYDQRKLVLLTGPPGTGKSIVLLLKGVRWLREGHSVHVISTRSASFAACCLVENQLNEMKSGGVGPPGKVVFHDYDFWNRPKDDGEKAIKELMTAANRERELYVLLDQFSTNPEKFSEAYENLLKSLHAACPKLHVWTASVRNKNIPPLMEEVRMDVPLRCPRNVLAEVQKGFSGDICEYDLSQIHHLPLLGPEVQHLSHSGEGHDGDWPVDCFLCGSKIGENLIAVLHNGGAAGASTSASTSTSPPPLKYSDVFILTRSSQLHDASPFVKGLEAHQIPVLVLSDPIAPNGQTPADMAKLKKELARVARSENVSKVVVARYGVVSGLERKVVVCLPGRTDRFDTKRSNEELEQHDRIHAMSRSAAHLIIIDMPVNAPAPRK